MASVDRGGLLDKLDNLSEDEAKNVVFILGPTWGNLSGATTRAKLQSLIEYLEPRHEVERLIATVAARYPHVLSADTTYAPPVVPAPSNAQPSVSAALSDEQRLEITTSQDPTTLVRKGIAYYQEDFKAIAVEYFTAAIRLKPNDANLYVWRGETYGDLGENNEALRDLTNAIVLDKEWTAAYDRRGRVFLAQGNYQRAIKDFDHVISDEGEDYPDPYYQRGLAHSQANNHPQAIADFQTYLRMFENDPPEARNEEQRKDAEQQLRELTT